MRQSIILGGLFVVAIGLQSSRGDDDAGAEPTFKPTLDDQVPIDADEALDRLRTASRTAREGLRSAITKAWFLRWAQGPGEKEPRLMTSGRVQTYYDDGKYHLKFSHDRMLCRTFDLPRGVFPSRVPGEQEIYRNGAGEVVEVKPRLADWKMTNIFVVNNGTTIGSRAFSPRIHPYGVRMEDLRDIQDVYTRVDSRLVDPIRVFRGIFDVEMLIDKLGKDAIQVRSLPNGGYRASYRLAPTGRAEMDAYPKDGFNVSASRVFNEGDDIPPAIYEATWRKINGQWVVTNLRSQKRFRAVKHLLYEKEILVFYWMEVNPWVDPSAFMSDSMDRNWTPRSIPAD